MFSVAKRQFSTSPIPKIAKFSITGRLGADVIKTYYGDKAIYKYSIASNAKANSDSADWFNITKFEESPNFEKIAKKGNLVQVDGDLVQNVYLKDDVPTYGYNFIQRGFHVISYAKSSENLEGAEVHNPTESEEIVKNS
mgnify:FL=1